MISDERSNQMFSVKKIMCRFWESSRGTKFLFHPFGDSRRKKENQEHYGGWGKKGGFGVSGIVFFWERDGQGQKQNEAYFR